MKHILFGSNVNDAKVAIVIKEDSLRKDKLQKYYIDRCSELSNNLFVAYSLWYNDKNKAPAKQAKEYMLELLAELKEMDIKHVLVCDTPYFKFMTKMSKVTGAIGYSTPCAIPGYEDINIVLCPSYRTIFYNPDNAEVIKRSLNTFQEAFLGTYEDPGQDVIHSAFYPKTAEEIGLALKSLREYPEVFIDIEGLSLDFWTAGISTIGFSWDEHNGIAFAVERNPDNTHQGEKPWEDSDFWRTRKEIRKIRQHLWRFFITYPGKITFHNISYDAKVLVYELFMANFQDYEGMINGIQQLTKKFDDTKLIAYLATNNAVENSVGLKALSAEYTGDYAEDVTDTRKVPITELLEYNLKDCMATAWVKKKYEPIMDADMQRELYEGLFKDSVITLLQTELCGMPINPNKVQIAKKKLQAIVNECHNYFNTSPLIRAFHREQRVALCDKKTAEAKKKVYTLEDKVIRDFVFNPASSKQVGKLLYEYLDLPVVDETATKAPSTGGKTLKKLEAHVKSIEEVLVLKYFQKLKGASKILESFIPAFERAVLMPDGSYRLFGNFNLGGTQSMRLSSSNPNLMQIPSGSEFAKIIKDCFQPIAGWLFNGADFAALEDKVGALLTRDPAKLKIYEDSYDGHNLRAFSYWPDKMPKIVLAEEGEKCFIANVGGTDIRIKSGDTVNYKGTVYSAEEFYEKAPSGGI